MTSAGKSDVLSGRNNGLLISFTILFCALAIASPTFLSPYTMFVLTRQVAFYILIALAQAVCLVVGGMNLSVGAMGGMATVLLGLSLDAWGLPPWLGVLLTMTFGAASGFVNGWLITRFRIDSFIVTLSMMFLYMGLRSGISGGQPYTVPASFSFIGQQTLFGIPYVFHITLLVLGLMAVVFYRTVLGRHLIATGSNATAARLSGVRTDRVVVAANVFSGLLAALAAVLWTSQLGSAAPETGDNWLIISFAVAIIGGTGLNGGVISTFGILMGAAIFMLIKHGLVEVKANPYFANAFLGALILLTIVVDRVRETWLTRRHPSQSCTPMLFRHLLICLLALSCSCPNRVRAATVEGTSLSAVAPKPLYRDPVYDGAADPVVIWNPHVKRWWMFYTNRRANLTNSPGVSWVHGTRLGIAESSDGGVTWKYVGTADIDLPPEFGGEQTTHWAPEVITAPDGTHHMFLSVVPGIFENWDHPRSIVHLTSRDLRHWTMPTPLKLASDRVIDACVLRLTNGTWRLWYNNERDRKSIYYADSPDLVNWTDKGKAVGDQAGEGPKVFRWRDAYWMVTDVWRGLAVYRSDDALIWTRQPGQILETPGTGNEDGVIGGHPDVVVNGDRASLFYFTHPGRRGPDARKDGYEQRRSSIQVVELQLKEGKITCNRDEPTHIQLQAPGEVATARPNPTDAFSVNIRVDASKSLGERKPVWRFFGADEPNYAYMPNGRKLLGGLGALRPEQVYFRAHNLLTSGDGTPALKWGSSGVYREDDQGKPIYDWAILDRIFDTYRALGVRPYAQIGFMPKDLSVKPEPYQHKWTPTAKYDEIYTGRAYPPKDYARWAELVYQWVRHCVDRYGQAEVEKWYWQVWNEPNIGYWRGTREEFFKLHDYAIDAVRRALPTARVGGPDVAGSGGKFSEAFFEHCLRGTNFATGRTGTPLDFVSFHAKGAPVFTNNHVRMGIAAHLRTVNDGFRIIAGFPELKPKPIVIGESDPEGCAACQGPQLGYRNGTMYSSYTAASFARIYELAERHGVNLEGVLTWAFTFETQPLFAGFRQLATGGLDLPVLNVFRMFSRMGGQRLATQSDAAVPLDEMMKSGVRERADVSVVASREGNRLCVLLWHYHDDDVPAPVAELRLTINGLAPTQGNARLTHYRVDENHSNAYTAWKEMNSPASPTDEQMKSLEAAGRLTLCEPVSLIPVDAGNAALRVILPRRAVSLIVLDL